MINADVPVYYINLDGSTSRQASIETNLRLCGITEYARFPAFDGREINLSSCMDFDEQTAVRWMGRNLGGGEYGCYKSHLAVIEQGLESSAEAFIVLEDDAALVGEFRETVTALLASLDRSDADWEIVHLAAQRLKYHTMIDGNLPTTTLHAAHYFPMTTTALLWSRKGAERFLRDARTIDMPVDNRLRKHFAQAGGAYAVWPPIARPIEGASEIDIGTSARRKHGRRWYYGIAKQNRLISEKCRAISLLIRFRVNRAIAQHKR